MFTITKENRPYLTYILTDDQARSSLEVVPERGGMITQWAIDNQTILYLNQERFSNPNLTVRGGIPILFPICGNLPNNTYEIHGHQYNLKQHGFARDLPWQVIKQDTNNQASLTLILNSNEKTLILYPFEFQLEFTYILQGNILKIVQQIKNFSQTKMPFSVGFHPYFQVDSKKDLTFHIPSHQYQDQQTKEILAFQGKFDFSQAEIDAGFTYLFDHHTSFTTPNYTVQIKYSEIYKTLVFWTLEGENYICLEPWSAPRNALNTGESLLWLEPQTQLETEIEIIYQKS